VLCQDAGSGLQHVYYFLCYVALQASGLQQCLNLFANVHADKRPATCRIFHPDRLYLFFVKCMMQASGLQQLRRQAACSCDVYCCANFCHREPPAAVSNCLFFVQTNDADKSKCLYALFHRRQAACSSGLHVLCALFHRRQAACSSVYMFCVLYYTADKRPAAVANMFCMLCFTADNRFTAVCICSVCFVSPQTSGLQQCVYVLYALFHSMKAACSSVYMFCVLYYTAGKQPAAVAYMFCMLYCTA